MGSEDRVMKSYVWHEDNCFFVSTIDRDSSAIDGGRYAETLVWHFDWEMNERLGLMGHGTSAGEGSIRGHIATCQRLHETGCLDEPEEE